MQTTITEMKDFWEQRYANPEFAYGKKPNAFFKAQLDQLDKKGVLLLLGEGEGRNAIYAALNGWQTIAMDRSEAAQQKTLNWADELGVNIEYALRHLAELVLMEGLFD